MSQEGRVTSRDGTTIAFERFGHGQPLVLVNATLHDRHIYRPLAEELSQQFAVVIYDRRGRGESGDTLPYAVEREIEDLAAVVSAAGGSASVYGHSSGAALVLHAAAWGVPMDAIVLHEPPFGSGSDQEQRAEQEEADQLAALLDEGRRSEAVALFLGSMGLPAEMVEQASHDPATLASAHTILYDPFEVTSQRSRHGQTPAQQASAVSIPALVLAGGASPEWMTEASQAIADALPHGQLRILDGHEHIVPVEVLTPVLAEFVARQAAAAGHQ